MRKSASGDDSKPSPDRLILPSRCCATWPRRSAAPARRAAPATGWVAATAAAPWRRSGGATEAMVLAGRDTWRLRNRRAGIRHLLLLQNTCQAGRAQHFGDNRVIGHGCGHFSCKERRELTRRRRSFTLIFYSSGRHHGHAMTNSDLTFTSPLSAAAHHSAPLLTLTVAWHPDVERIGEQCIWTDDAEALELSRFVPAFRKPGREGAGLGYGGISRAPLRLVQEHDGLTIAPSPGRMAVGVNGVEISAPIHLSHAQLEAGAILSLGRTVLLCLHWMRCLPKHNPVDGWLGVGTAAIKTRDLIRQVAATDATVLLLGETGTGKDVAARGIHALSRRAQTAMVSVNMAALNEALAAADLFGAARGAYTGAQASRPGLFAEAQDSTLFLDEVGNTPASVQPMLLRVLESGDYRPLGASRDVHSDARLIAATDQDLYGGGFNQALLRRLESFIIQIPPLRTRREDIGVLMLHLWQSSKLAGGAGLVPPAPLVAQFLQYDWPGNVRQLAHVFKRAMLALHAGEAPDFAALVDRHPARRPWPAPAGGAAAAPSAGAAGQARKKLADLGEQDVLAAMEQSAWYIQGAAQLLGVSRPSMYKLLEAHPQIRGAEQIAADELRLALAACDGDVEDCASRLKTPTEALRRRLRTLRLER